MRRFITVTVLFVILAWSGGTVRAGAAPLVAVHHLMCVATTGGVCPL